MTTPIPHDISILVIEMPSWVGDCVMATPLLRAARQACPAAKIIGIMRPGLDQLLDGCPYLDERIAISTRGLRGVMRTARTLRALQPDAILLLPNSFRSGLAARLGGVKRRIGYASDGRSTLLTHGLRKALRDPHSIPRSLDPLMPASTIDHYAVLGEFALGRTISDRRPELWITQSEEHEAARLLGEVNEFALLNPGGNKAAKRWPVERFARVATQLQQRCGLTMVINGSPGEAGIAAELAAQCPGAVNLIVRGVTLSSLKAIIRRSRLLITNDTGPRHLAAALGTPTVSLFGPTDHRWTTLLEAREHVLIAEPFLPEELVADDHPDLCAIDRIAENDVLFAAARLLEERAPN